MPHAIYEGIVTHARLRPVRHRLRYRVFALLLDCNALAEAGKSLRLFSLNRPNLVSLYEKDHADGEGNLCSYLAHIATEAGFDPEHVRFSMLFYPRILGYAFNPLTTYYGFTPAGDIALMVYEVRNTFGQRLTYVLRPGVGEGQPHQCDKQLYVSPFNKVEGRYVFRVATPADQLNLDITLQVEGETVLKAAFSAEKRPFTDKTLLAALARTGWMTLKVVAGIHIEALRLWFKGLRIKPRPDAAKRRLVSSRHRPPEA